MSYLWCLLYRRSWLFHLFCLLFFTVFGIVIYEVILTIPYWHLPVGLVEEKAGDIVVQLTDSTTELHLDYSTVFPIGTPLYCMDDELELVGYISSVRKQEGNYLFHVQILKKDRERIFFQNTRFRFMHSSPMLWIALKKFFEGEQMIRLRSELEDVMEDCKEKGENILFVFKDIMLKQGKAENLVQQIVNDAYLKNVLFKVISKKCSESTDWQNVFQKIQKSQATYNVSLLAQQKIQKRKIFWEGFKGIFLLSPLKKAQDEFLKQGKEFILENDTYLLEQLGHISLEVSKESGVVGKSVKSMHDILGNSEVQQYVVAKYGNDTYTLLQDVALELKNSRRIKNSLQQMQMNIQEILTKWLEALVLNEEKAGPNPWLLLAMRQALAAGRPMIIVYPDESEKRIATTAGYQYFSNMEDWYDE